MDRSKTFLAGLAAGLFLAHRWKPLTREAIKAGVLAGRKLKVLSEQALEDIEDAAAEAVEELSGREREVDGK